MSQVGLTGVRTISKVKWRLIPFLFVLYIINVIDRGNLSYAALTMNSELNLSPAAFGALSSIFFIPYFLFEVPSNMLLHRFGARKWLARIMITWGIVTSAAMFSNSFAHIATVRFFLGMMEAGFFPGVLFYFTLWFPQRERAKVIAFFMMALPVSIFISSGAFQKNRFEFISHNLLKEQIYSAHSSDRLCKMIGASTLLPLIPPASI